MMTGEDELFELRNYFYLGNLSAAWTEGETVRVDDDSARIERDVIMARIRLARGEYDGVIGSIGGDATPALRVIGLLASVMKDPSGSDSAAATLADWAEDAAMNKAPCFALCCALLYTRLGDRDAALRSAHRAGGLEGAAVAVHVMLGMDRADAATERVAHMVRDDEDATLTQLAGAWVKLAGGANVQDAVYTYQDLLERHGATDGILNGQALCALARGRPADAEKAINEALSKNPNCAATLINAIVTARHRNKQSELVNRYLEQLAKVQPNNPWLKQYREKESEFDKLAAQMQAA